MEENRRPLRLRWLSVASRELAKEHPQNQYSNAGIKRILVAPDFTRPSTRRQIRRWVTVIPCCYLKSEGLARFDPHPSNQFGGFVGLSVIFAGHSNSYRIGGTCLVPFKIIMNPQIHHCVLLCFFVQPSIDCVERNLYTDAAVVLIYVAYCKSAFQRRREIARLVEL